MRAAPIPDDNVTDTAGDMSLFMLISDNNGAAMNGAIPVARNPIPPKMVSNAIIVTPSGLCFCCCCMILYDIPCVYLIRMSSLQLNRDIPKLCVQNHQIIAICPRYLCNYSYDISTRNYLEQKRVRKQPHRSESVTIRVDSIIFSKLLGEAEQKEISFNTLASQILRQHADWHSHAAKAGFMTKVSAPLDINIPAPAAIVIEKEELKPI